MRLLIVWEGLNHKFELHNIISCWECACYVSLHGQLKPTWGSGTSCSVDVYLFSMFINYLNILSY